MLPPEDASKPAVAKVEDHIEPDNALALQRVQGEIAKLRAAYPELDWSFVGTDLTPPTWPPEVPRACTASQTKPKRPTSGRTGASPTPRPHGMLPRPQDSLRPLVPARPLLMHTPVCRGPGYKVLSANRSGPAYTMAARLLVARDVDPMLADDDGPGPGQYDLQGTSMGNGRHGPSYSMAGRTKGGLGASLGDTGAGPGQYDTCKY